jgi:hypothetical protein
LPAGRHRPGRATPTPTASLWTTTAPAVTAALSVPAERSRLAPVRACGAWSLPVPARWPAVLKDSAWPRPGPRRTDRRSSGLNASRDRQILRP